MALSPKQKKFVSEYLIDGNATRAAERAGYKGDDATLASVGWENLRKPEIADAISRRTSESAMPAEEVLKRLADQARSTMADFVTFDEKGNLRFDLQGAAMLSKLGLIKKLKTKTRTYTTAAVTVRPGSDDEAQEAEEDSQEEDSQEEGRVEIEDVEVTETTVELELYDAQAALVHIGKHHGLFDKGPTGTEKDPIHIKHIKEIRPSGDNTTE